MTSYDSIRTDVKNAGANWVVRRHDKLVLRRHEELAPSLSREGLLDDHFID